MNITNNFFNNAEAILHKKISRITKKAIYFCYKKMYNYHIINYRSADNENKKNTCHNSCSSNAGHNANSSL